MNISPLGNNAQCGKVDIVISIGLLVASALILIYSGNQLEQTLTHNQIELPITVGENTFIVKENTSSPFGSFSLFIDSLKDVSIRGEGDLFLADGPVRLEFTGTANLLGQLQKAQLQISSEEESVQLIIQGIYPLHALTLVTRRKTTQRLKSTYQEHIECSLQQHAPLRCSFGGLMKKLNLLLKSSNIEISPRGQNDAVVSETSSVTFNDIQNATLSIHSHGDYE